MSIPVVINGSTYQIPTEGQSPPWGTQVSDILVALAAESGSSVGPHDILPTVFTLSNNVSSPSIVSGLAFDQATVRSAQITYSIDRSTSTTEYSENGTIYASYNSLSNTWSQSQFSDGNAQVNFTITNGQFSYTSSNMTGSTPTGKLIFSAKASVQ